MTFPAATLTAPSSWTVKVRVTDVYGNSASDEAQVNVIWAFAGFFSPIDNLPAVNLMKAGAAVPVKFSLGGGEGLEIFVSGYPKSSPIACNATEPVDAVDETLTAGSSGLGYDAATGQYRYTWKTDKT